MEKTTIHFSKTTVGTIICVISVLGAIAFWSDRGSDQATAKAADAFLLSSHETRITKTEVDIGDVKKESAEFKEQVKDRFVSNERVQQALQRDQREILGNQGEIKQQLIREADIRNKRRDADLEVQRKLTDEVGKLSGYLRSIEKIE